MRDHAIPSPPGNEQADQGDNHTRPQAPGRRVAAFDANTVVGLQRSVGNSAFGRLLDVQRTPLADPLKPPTHVSDSTPRSRRVPLGSQSEYRGAAQGYVDGYRESARDGIDDFKDAISPDFDWDLFAAQVLGNVVWAGACFATGGTAFAVSMLGIAMTTASAAGAAVSAPTFGTDAKKNIDIVWTYLHDQVDGLTSRAYDQATREGWDDTQTREELLRQLFKPTFVIDTGGGPPMLDRRAVAASVMQQLLVRANATQPRKGNVGTAALIRMMPTVIREKYTGYVMYSYKVGGVAHDEGFWHSDTMNEPSQWRVEAGPAVALVPSANVGDINSSMNEAQQVLHTEAMHVAAWACKKAINLYEDDPQNPVAVVRLDEANRVVGVDGWGVVHGRLEELPSAVLAFDLAHRVWGSTTPPDVARLSAPPELFEVNTSATGPRP